MKIKEIKVQNESNDEVVKVDYCVGKEYNEDLKKQLISLINTQLSLVNKTTSDIRIVISLEDIIYLGTRSREIWTELMKL